jgi:transposase InsO family protein
MRSIMRYMIACRRIATTWCTHSDRGSQYVSIKYTERLAETGIEPSVGSVGDSYDNALAETINGLYKAELIHRRGPWRSFEAVEYAPSTGSTASTIGGRWGRSATSRLPTPKINIILPRTTSIWQRDSQPNASGRPGAVHNRWRVARRAGLQLSELTGARAVFDQSAS